MLFHNPAPQLHQKTTLQFLVEVDQKGDMLSLAQWQILSHQCQGKDTKNISLAIPVTLMINMDCMTCGKDIALTVLLQFLQLVLRLILIYNTTDLLQGNTKPAGELNKACQCLNILPRKFTIFFNI